VNGVTSAVDSAVGLTTSTSSSTTSTVQATTSRTNNNPPPRQTASSSSSSSSTPDATPTQAQDTQSSSSLTSTSTSSLTTATSSSSLLLNSLSTPTSLTSQAQASSTLTFVTTSDGNPVTVTTVTTFPASDSSFPSPTSLASQTTSSSSSFFNNKALVGAVFGIGGLVGLVLIVTVLTCALRRSRRSRLERDAADVDGTIDWSADAGVGGSMSSTYTGMPIIGQLERGGSPLNRNGSGRSNSSRNASTSPIGSEDGLLAGGFGGGNGYNYGSSAEGPAAANLGRRPSNGEQQMGMAMNNAMPTSMGMPLNRAVSVSRQEGAPVNVPGQLYVPLPPSLGLSSNAPRTYGGPQQQQSQAQAQPRRQSIRAFAFQQRQQTSQLPYAQPRSLSPPYQQSGQAVAVPQPAQIGAYPTAQLGRNRSGSDGGNTFGRARSGSGGSNMPDSPADDGDYYAEYNYGGQNVGKASELRVANE